MNIRNRIIALCLGISSMLVMSSYAQSPGSIMVTLKGEVKDQPQSSQLLLIKQSADPRINVVYIPINDGKFEYIFNCEHEELYYLDFYDDFVQRSMRRRVSFFSEHGVVNFILYPNDQSEKNVVEGGKLNREYWNYFSKMLSMNNAVFNAFNAYLEDNYSEALNKHGALEKDFSEKLKILNQEGIDVSQALDAISDSTDQEMSRWQLQYIKESTPIVGYSILFSTVNTLVNRNRIFQESNDISLYADLYQTLFAPKFPDHPYLERMQYLFAGSSIKKHNERVTIPEDASR